MIIEPTGEMLDVHKAVWRSYWTALDHMAVGMTVAEHGRAAHRACLAAVFVIVVRDYFPFFCPVSGDIRSLADGNFAACCDRPELHCWPPPAPGIDG